MQNKNIKTALIDGYLDEPSCLGVPPYISPHIRYTYGALLSAGFKEDNINYYTIDSLRERWKKNIEKLENFDLIIIIAGTTVPGNYLGGQPISIKEIKELGEKLHYPNRVLGGPITLVKDNFPEYDHLCGEIAALDLYQTLTEKKIKSQETAKWIGEWSRLGADLTTKHPDYPHLVCEIETFRGCPRQSGHCTFCSERLKKRTYQRNPKQIIAEIDALAKKGNHHFRLGCQTNLLLYQAHKSKNELIPNPGAIKELYTGINRADPDLKTLHMDNMNPEDIAKHQRKSREILKIITKYNTPGDIAAFGLESADPQVIEKNNIGADPEKTLKAIEIMNEIGGRREKGLPKLLPGLNFLHGLIGEREETMEYNYRYLKKIYKKGLMLRRINIRQVIPVGDYPRQKVDKYQLKEYKDRINEEINKPMLKRVFPAGTILRNVRTEKRKGKLTYGRQLGTYPILVGIPGKPVLNKFIDVKIVDHGYRSVTALPWPFDIKKASPDELTYLNGIGRNRASEIFLKQPETKEELAEIVGEELASLFFEKN
ncbi:MAG: radical SAM protein [Halanaerobiales bacterium]